MKIIKSKNKIWSPKKGYSKKIFLNSKDLGIKGALVQEIKIKIGDTAKNHYHKKQTEIFYFITNNGYWIINGERKELEVGDVLVIEPFDKHEVVNNTSSDYIYIAFKYNYDEDDIFWE